MLVLAKVIHYSHPLMVWIIDTILYQQWCRVNIHVINVLDEADERIMDINATSIIKGRNANDDIK